MERPVVVQWRDTYASDATQWVSPYEYPAEEVIISTCGFIVPGYLEHYLVIADSFHDNSGEPYYAGLNYIPKAMVVDITIV